MGHHGSCLPLATRWPADCVNKDLQRMPNRCETTFSATTSSTAREARGTSTRAKNPERIARGRCPLASGPGHSAPRRKTRVCSYVSAIQVLDPLCKRDADACPDPIRIAILSKRKDWTHDQQQASCRPRVLTETFPARLTDGRRGANGLHPNASQKRQILLLHRGRRPYMHFAEEGCTLARMKVKVVIHGQGLSCIRR
jgi:hypothetical protein